MPKDFGKGELIWTVTSRGKTERAVGWLQPEWEIDPVPRRATRSEGNKAPTLSVVSPGQIRPGRVALTAKASDDAVRNSILVFSLITSEMRLLLAYVERRALKNTEPGTPLNELYDSFVYCLPLELKKVVNTELLDISAARQPDIVRARVENSHGILKDCFQQSVVQMAQALDPKVQGLDIFPDFTAKLEQSVQLRDNLAKLIGAVRVFQTTRDEAAAQGMKTQISAFYDHSMKDLMYRDWSGFELFFIEILKCSSLPALQQIGHRFETFLMTLYREVQKRAILQTVPPSDAVMTLDLA